MNVSPLAWGLTLFGAALFLALDIFVIGRQPHEPTVRESVAKLAVFIGAAAVFGVGVLLLTEPRYGTEFFAGWLTEYSLSVDNLFVFLIILTRFRVPRQLQQSALLIGIVLALVLRGAFIAVGAAAINRFSWVFYLFGAFLVYTAVTLARQGVGGDHPDGPGADTAHAVAEYTDPRTVRLLRRMLPSTDEYAGSRLTVRRGGRRLVTPMTVVIVALGSTDLLFALDSIPAIYGLTSEPYLVLTANLFALMGLRQLYFLLGGLLSRLVYLSTGLSVLLGFIGVKLVLHALHENSLPFVNGGESVHWAPDLPIWLSLSMIVGILGVTTAASLWRSGPASGERASGG